MPLRPRRALLAPTLRHYERAWLRRDVLSGITVATLLVPQAMAYAQIAGLPPQNGLYASVLPIIVFAILSTSRFVAVGPNAAVAVMVPAAVAPLAGGDESRYIALAGALSIVVGVVCALAGVLRGGFVVTLLSVSVLLGYLSGLALTIVASQLGGILGLEVSGSAFFDRIVDVLRSLDEISTITLAVGLGALAVLVVGPHLTRRRNLPWPLIVLVAGIVVSQALELSDRGVAVVGSFPSGLPIPGIPDVSASDVVSMTPAAIGIALVAYIQTITVAIKYADEHRQALRQNQELAALGGANVAAGLVQGLPVNGSLTRTALDEQSGRVTQMASIVSALAVAVILVAFSSSFAALPTAVLSALVILTAFRLIEWGRLDATMRVSREEAMGAGVALVGTLALGPIAGLLIAVIVSLVALVYRASRPHSAVLGYVPSQGAYRDVTRYGDATETPGLLMFRFDGPLFFANALSFRERVQRLLARADPPATCLIVDAEAITHIDLTAVGQFEQLLDDLERDGVTVLVTRAKGPTYDRMQRFGLVERIGPQRFFSTNHAAVRHFHEELSAGA